MTRPLKRCYLGIKVGKGEKSSYCLYAQHEIIDMGYIPHKRNYSREKLVDWQEFAKILLQLNMERVKVFIEKPIMKDTDQKAERTWRNLQLIIVACEKAFGNFYYVTNRVWQKKLGVSLTEKEKRKTTAIQKRNILVQEKSKAFALSILPEQDFFEINLRTGVKTKNIDYYLTDAFNIAYYGSLLW